MRTDSQEALPVLEDAQVETQVAGPTLDEVVRMIANLAGDVKDLRSETVTKAYETGVSDATEVVSSEGPEMVAIKAQVQALQAQLVQSDFKEHVTQAALTAKMHLGHLTAHLQSLDIAQRSDGSFEVQAGGRSTPLSLYVDQYAATPDGKMISTVRTATPTGVSQVSNAPAATRKLTAEEMCGIIFNV